MNAKTIIAMLLIAVLVAVAVAAIVSHLNILSQANIKPNIIYYLDGTAVTNETIIDWGEMIAGSTYQKNFTAYNQGNINFTLTMTFDGLPADWNSTWTGNNTLVMPKTSIVGNLTLTPALNAQARTMEVVNGTIIRNEAITYKWLTVITETAPTAKKSTTSLKNSIRNMPLSSKTMNAEAKT